MSPLYVYALVVAGCAVTVASTTMVITGVLWLAQCEVLRIKEPDGAKAHHRQGVCLTAMGAALQTWWMMSVVLLLSGVTGNWVSVGSGFFLGLLVLFLVIAIGKKTY